MTAPPAVARASLGSEDHAAVYAVGLAGAGAPSILPEPSSALPRPRRPAAPGPGTETRGSGSEPARGEKREGDRILDAGSARAFVGLALLGWGLSILLAVSPHEDRIAGAALAGFGGVLLATSPRWPTIERMPRAVMGVAGLALAVGVVVHGVRFDVPLNAPKATLVAFGAGLALAAPWLRSSITLAGRRVRVAALVSCAFAVLGAPLAAWGVQALFESAVGDTPVEFFLRHALLGPLSGAVGLLGLAPTVDGQVLAYATPRGRLAVNVGAACSGIQAMALFTGVLALVLLVERPRGRRLVLWSAVGVGGVYVANLVRLLGLVLIGHRWGGDALLRAHAQAGWIVFVAWALLFVRLARRRAPRPRGPGSGPNAHAP